MAMRMHVSAQVNVRIAAKKSYLYPKIQDALVPVYWMSETVEPPQRVLEMMYDLQHAPFQISIIFHILFWHGLCYIGCCQCYLCSVVMHEKQHKKQQHLLGN